MCRLALLLSHSMKPRLKRVYIEISNTCNLHCPFCITKERPAQVMPVELFEKAAKEAATVANHVYLHVLGEPLMHPHLEDVLRICADNSLEVNITTNATKLRERLDVLKRNPARLLSISVHDWRENFSATECDEIMRNTIECADEISPLTYVSFRLWNMDDFYQDESQEAEFNRRMRTILCEHYGVDIKDIKEHGSNPMSERVFLQNDRRFAWPDKNAPIVKKKTCLGLKQQIAVLANGTIVPCCIDANATMPLGNIRDMSLIEALESPRAQRIIEGFNNRIAVEETCQRCGFRRY